MGDKTEKADSSYPSYKNYKKNWKQWIIIYVVIAIVAYSGFYYFVLAKKSTNPYAPQSTNYVTPTTTQPTVTPDPTAGWKTYTNQKYDYSVKYPSNLKVNESETSYDQYVEFTLGRDASGNAYVANYTVTVAKEDFQAKNAASVNFMSADWTNSFYAMNVGDTKTEATVSFKKLPSVVVAGQNAVVMQVVGSSQKRYLLKKNGYLYMISDFNGSADFQNALKSFSFSN